MCQHYTFFFNFSWLVRNILIVRASDFGIFSKPFSIHFWWIDSQGFVEIKETNETYKFTRSKLL